MTRSVVRGAMSIQVEAVGRLIPLLVLLFLASMNRQQYTTGLEQQHQQHHQPWSNDNDVVYSKDHLSDPDDSDDSLDDFTQSRLPGLPLTKRGNVKWMKSLCGRRDDWCDSGPNAPEILQCCPGFHCVCRLLWSSNCKCRSRLFGWIPRSRSALATSRGGNWKKVQLGCPLMFSSTKILLSRWKFNYLCSCLYVTSNLHFNDANLIGNTAGIYRSLK